MGGSRRRKANKTSSHAKVRIGLPRIKPRAPPAPVVLPGDGEIQVTEWDNTKTQTQNYKALGLFSDPKLRGGRNNFQTKKTEEEEEEDSIDEDETEDTEEVKELKQKHDDELKGTLGESRSTGIRDPPKLTTMQRIIVGKMVDAHGGDFRAMARDRKLNKMQHSEGKLKLLVEGYLAYPELEKGGSRGFHAPKKRC
mmetsp:Transcript_41026/g.49782  ORF Transcript_41026/g.49782 Transcript_41026/m.49782 type:complete len:196 (+) Transcript_41026:281-868(+)